MLGRRLFPVLCLAALTLAGAADSNDTEAPPHANHIFNAIHSAMRQWGSSLNHNGMSFFLATVPKGTQFYHGTSVSQPVNGTEWLAFEPEHAMGFARPSRHGPPGRGPPPDASDDKDAAQQPLGLDSDEPSSDAVNAGYLHTYVAARDLRLLYLDGMAAAKSAIGTLDASDHILLNDSVGSFEEQTAPGQRPGGPPGEQERAIQGCRMVQEVWDDRIDGILRMEAGFEIILCSFERDLEVVRITQAKAQEDRGPRRHGPGEQQGGKMKAKAGGGGGGGHNSWLKAIAARYHSIGGHRVIVDYDHFVTAYTYGLDLFVNGSQLPRVNHIPTEQMEPIRRDIDHLVLTREPSRHSFDWQSVTDMIITRYSDELQVLASGNFTSAGSLREELERVLAPFIDYSDYDNAQAITERCAEQFIPKHAPKHTLASQVVHHVSRTICSTMTSVLLNPDVELETAVSHFKELISYLSWTTWKNCRGCAYDELCLIPMWPTGTVEDYEHPRCQNPNGMAPRGKSYWGDRGFGRPRDEL